jgi:hypothetical protein
MNAATLPTHLIARSAHEKAAVATDAMPAHALRATTPEKTESLLLECTLQLVAQHEQDCLRMMAVSKRGAR